MKKTPKGTQRTRVKTQALSSDEYETMLSYAKVEGDNGASFLVEALEKFSYQDSIHTKEESLHRRLLQAVAAKGTFNLYSIP